jgi:hypothetical protein
MSSRFFVMNELRSSDRKKENRTYYTMMKKKYTFEWEKLSHKTIEKVHI